MGHRMLLPLAYLPLDRYNDQKEGIVKASTRFLYLVTRTLAERARELLRFLQALVKGNLKQAAVELGNAPKVHSCISATLVFIMAGFIPRFLFLQRLLFVVFVFLGACAIDSEGDWSGSTAAEGSVLWNTPGHRTITAVSI